MKINLKEAENIIDKAVSGGEIGNAASFEDWINKRLLPNLLFIDEKGYSQMCIDALKILSKTAPTD